MSRLSAEARQTVRDYGLTVAAFTRAMFEDGEWWGDACGCIDDRCRGHHHDAEQRCGCLPALLDDLTAG